MALVALASLALAAAGVDRAPHMTGTWWFAFPAAGTTLSVGARNSIARFPELLPVLADPAFFVCSTNSVGGHGDARRAAVLQAMVEAEVPRSRMLDGGQCQDGVTGRGGDNAESVFVAMGDRAEFQAYFVQR